MCDPEPDGRGYFIGYNAESRHRVGYLGRAGFRADIPPDHDRFPLKQWAMLAAESATYGKVPVGQRVEHSPVYLCSDQKPLAVDLEGRSIRQVEMPSAVLSIAGYQEPKLVDDEREAIYTWRVAARLADRIVLLDMQGEIVRTIVIPPSLRDRDLSLYNTVGPGVVLHVGDVGLPSTPWRAVFR